MLVKRLILISAIITALGGIGALSGVICNKLVVDANGGQMPIVPPSGYEESARDFCEKEKEHTGLSTYKVADKDTKYLFLSDRFYRIRTDGDMVFVSFYSLGDVLMRAGDLVFNLGFFFMSGFLVILVFTDKKLPAKVAKD